MSDFILLGLLAAALIGPPTMLVWRGGRLGWVFKYLISALPGAYTGLAYLLATKSFKYLDCEGGIKGVEGCMLAGLDVSLLVDHGFFLSIPFLFIGAPLSLWLLIDTGARQIGAWHRKVIQKEQHCDEHP